MVSKGTSKPSNLANLVGGWALGVGHWGEVLDGDAQRCSLTALPNSNPMTGEPGADDLRLL